MSSFIALESAASWSMAAQTAEGVAPDEEAEADGGEELVSSLESDPHPATRTVMARAFTVSAITRLSRRWFTTYLRSGGPSTFRAIGRRGLTRDG